MKPISHITLESISLNASISPQHNTCYNTNYSFYRGGIGRGTGSSNTNTFRRNSSTDNRSNLFYEYCKWTGHTNDRCYKIHGYPTNARTQKEEVRDLQQMCTLLRMMDINVRKILSSEGKFHWFYPKASMNNYSTYLWPCKFEMELIAQALCQVELQT